MTPRKQGGLEELLDLVETRVAEIGVAHGYDDWKRIDAATAALLAGLERDHGAVYRHSWLGGGTHHLRLAGIATTSTSSQLGVLKNWCAGAHRRLARSGRP